MFAQDRCQQPGAHSDSLAFGADLQVAPHLQATHYEAKKKERKWCGSKTRLSLSKNEGDERPALHFKGQLSSGRQTDGGHRPARPQGRRWPLRAQVHRAGYAKQKCDKGTDSNGLSCCRDRKEVTPRLPGGGGVHPGALDEKLFGVMRFKDGGRSRCLKPLYNYI